MILIRDSIINDAVLGSLLIDGTKICDAMRAEMQKTAK